MSRKWDCIVCGSCVVDMLCRPVELDRPIGFGKLHVVGPMEVTAGGITSNAGAAMARMDMKTCVFSYVGKDAWAPVIRELYRREGIDDTLLLEHPTGATSTTWVAIAPSGERSFFHCVGAPKLLNKQAFDDHMDQLVQSRAFMMGYYSLMPNLESDFAGICEQLRKHGVMTILESAASGGSMQPLDRILPHLDVFVPSRDEAINETGESDPRRIIDRFRSCGCKGVLGVKMGTDGVMLSGKAGEYLDISICTPPGPVMDTTGAGDNFLGGLVTGLLRGLGLRDAGKLGAATAACSVTTLGGATGGRDYAFTAKLAGVA